MVGGWSRQEVSESELEVMVKELIADRNGLNHNKDHVNVERDADFVVWISFVALCLSLCVLILVWNVYKFSIRCALYSKSNSILFDEHK
mmetsp:Transcript_8162/g.14787  ORF Transcript_8162/g.14787 Transcript_8162/m.14787 type:complete len:89 (+) Transcript_8162:937-1203(+)